MDKIKGKFHFLFMTSALFQPGVRMTHPRICQENATTGAAFLSMVHGGHQGPRSIEAAKARSSSDGVGDAPWPLPMPLPPLV